MTRPLLFIPGSLILLLSSRLVNHTFNPPNPCTSTIKTVRQHFFIDDPILISFSIKNVSKDTIRIWHCGFWCNNKIVVTDNINVEVPRTEWGKATVCAFFPGGARNKNYPVSLAPGETDFLYENYDLKGQFLFPTPGVYYVRYFYHELDEKTEIKIESNTLRIQIDKGSKN